MEHYELSARVMIAQGFVALGQKELMTEHAQQALPIATRLGVLTHKRWLIEMLDASFDEESPGVALQREFYEAAKFWNITGNWRWQSVG